MLKALDTMSIIVGSRTAEDPFKWYTENDGVDFLFNGTNTLCISIRYQWYIYLPSKCVPWRYLERLINRWNPFASDSDDDDDDDDSSEEELPQVCVDSMFAHENCIYKVWRVNASTADCRCVHPREDSHGVDDAGRNFTLLQVANLIQAYNDE